MDRIDFSLVSSPPFGQSTILACTTEIDPGRSGVSKDAAVILTIPADIVGKGTQSFFSEGASCPFDSQHAREERAGRTKAKSRITTEFDLHSIPVWPYQYTPLKENFPPAPPVAAKIIKSGKLRPTWKMGLRSSGIEKIWTTATRWKTYLTSSGIQKLETTRPAKAKRKNDDGDDSDYQGASKDVTKKANKRVKLSAADTSKSPSAKTLSAKKEVVEKTRKPRAKKIRCSACNIAFSSVELDAHDCVAKLIRHKR